MDDYMNEIYGDKALEALHVAAEAIREMDGVSNVSVDNDNDSGEIFFRTDNGDFVLKLDQDC